MPRHGVQVVMIDEAHHVLSGGNGANGATLQEQLEWLKSLSSTAQILHIMYNPKSTLFAMTFSTSIYSTAVHMILWQRPVPNPAELLTRLPPRVRKRGGY